MKKILARKGLVVGIIVLFIVIGIQPAISNEITIPTISDSEEDCIECQSNGKTHLTERLLTRLEKNELLSDVIDFNNPQDDRPICEFLFGFIDKYMVLMYIYKHKAAVSQYGTFEYFYYHYLWYMYGIIIGFFAIPLALLGCIEPYPPIK